VLNAERVIENAGFIVKFEKGLTGVSATLQPEVKRPKLGQSYFQFKYDRGRVILGEYIDNPNSDVGSQPIEASEMAQEELLQSHMVSNEDHDKSGDKSMLKSVVGAAIPEKKEAAKTGKEGGKESSDDKIDYALGIKTLRLMNGKPQEIEQQDPDEMEEDEELQQNPSIFRRDQQEEMLDGGEDFSKREFSTTFKSRKIMNSIINDKTVPPAIRNLKYTANILILALFIIAGVDYFITISEFNDIQENVNLITISNNQVSELMNVLGRVRDLQLIQTGLFSRNGANYTETQFRNGISMSLLEIESIQRTMQLSGLSVSSAHQALLTSKSVNMAFLSGAPQQFTLNEATQQIVSKAQSIVSSRLNNITQNNSDVYFVEYNLFNDYYMALRNSTQHYVLELMDRATQKKNTFLILLIISAVTLFAAVLVLFPVLHSVNKTREEVLSLFLDIPEKTVKMLYTRCENFISTLQVGEDEDVISEVDEESMDKGQEDDDALQEYQPRKKRKRFKNSGKSQRNFYLKFLIGALILEAYYIYNYYMSQSLLTDLSQLIPEINSTSLAESFSAFVNNVERKLIINPLFPVLNGKSSTIAVGNIQALYNLDSDINQQHSVNIGIHSDLYKATFNQLMMLDPCPIYVANVSDAECIAFADGAVNQGIAVAITRHFENLRYMLTLQVKYTADPNAAFDGVNTTYVKVNNNTQKDNLLNIFNLEQAIEVGNLSRPHP
jgi:hypothetical protein